MMIDDSRNTVNMVHVYDKCMSLRTFCDPIASHVGTARPIAPAESFSHNVLHHRHVQVDRIVQKQGINGTLHDNEYCQPVFTEQHKICTKKKTSSSTLP